MQNGQPGRSRAWTTHDVAGLRDGLRGLSDVVSDGFADGAVDGADDAALIDRIRVLEEVKAAAAAAQAVATAQFAASQRAEQRAERVPAERVGAGIGAQVALARRASPWQGARHLGLAEALVHEMPRTLAALAAGVISEWRATLIARETACLSVPDRARVDAELATRPDGIGALGDRQLAAETRRIAYRLDPYAFTARARRAESERRVTVRPAPDTMSQLSALLPARQGIAAWAALVRAADAARAAGDPRRRGQVMADTLVERLTGQASAPAVPVEVNLHIGEDALFGDDPDTNTEPADLEGYGPVPAPHARDWLRPDDPDEARGSSEPDAAAARTWLRRLYHRPSDGQLVAMDSRRRLFDGGRRRFVIAKDRVCRTPWCDAPARHGGHPKPARRGGTTNALTGQGLCEACNYAKEAAGWTTTVTTDGQVSTTTPTGHGYTTRRPPGLGRPPPPDADQRLAS